MFLPCGIEPRALGFIPYAIVWIGVHKVLYTLLASCSASVARHGLSISIYINYIFHVHVIHLSRRQWINYKYQQMCHDNPKKCNAGLQIYKAKYVNVLYTDSPLKLETKGVRSNTTTLNLNKFLFFNIQITSTTGRPTMLCSPKSTCLLICQIATMANFSHP